jgi:uncharacterized membrane protein
MGGQQGAALVFNKSVQDELKLTDDQKQQLTKVQTKQREAMQKVFQEAAGDREKMREAMQAAQKETAKDINGVLKPDQQKRFKQIQLQVGGARALQNPETASQLNLSDKQKEEVKGILDDAQKDSREILQDAQGDRERMQAALKKIQKVNQDATAKALKVLNADQQTKYKEMTGSKFDFKPDQGGFGFGGRGRGRGKNKNKQDQ